jgi:hypothetical protein
MNYVASIDTANELGYPRVPRDIYSSSGEYLSWGWGTLDFIKCYKLWSTVDWADEMKEQFR